MQDYGRWACTHGVSFNGSRYLVHPLRYCVLTLQAEIAAAYPTCGGIYFWSYRLGGVKWGPFLAWLTAWWNWVGTLLKIWSTLCGFYCLPEH